MYCFFFVSRQDKGHLYDSNENAMYSPPSDVMMWLDITDPGTMMHDGSMMMLSLSLPPFVVTNFPSAGFRRFFLRTFEHTMTLSLLQ